ncbi:hypothetical protein BDQ17DRAFT_1362390 [Cyathus striatus]|nr:hypothetical protein BDQ17DRAFT_1362390 [Cyathus striatus]
MECNAGDMRRTSISVTFICTKRCNVLTLPQEIIHCILGFADYKTLLTCCSVCKELRDLIETSAEHTYVIELALEGLVDSGTSIESHAERLRQLRERRANWVNVDYQKMQSIKMSDRCHAYELVGGIFAKTDGRDLFVAYLPSRYNEKCVTNNRDLESLSDLIVLLERGNTFVSFFQNREVTLRIRALSSNKDHPSACSPSLHFTILPDETHGNLMREAFLQVADDIVGLYFTNSPDLLNFMAYKLTATLQDTSHGHIDPLLTMVNSRDFAFLSSRSFVVTSIVDFGCLHIYSFSYPSTDPPTLVATLDFPSLVEGVMVHRILTHAAPILSNPPAGSTFTTARDSRVHVISISYNGMHNSPNTSHQYTLFVHNRTLMKFVEGFNEGKERIIRWEDWGPQNTRLFARPIPPHWLRYVHGERVVFASQGDEIVRMFDFNVASAQYGLSSNRELFRGPYVMDEPALFVDKVHTHLPFHSVTFTVDKPHYAYMIDEDRILGLKANPFHDGDVTEMDIYAF